VEKLTPSAGYMWNCFYYSNASRALLQFSDIPVGVNQKPALASRYRFEEVNGYSYRHWRRKEIPG